MSSLISKLEVLYQKREISLLELEFACFLEGLDPEIQESVLIAGAACVHFQSKGHICSGLKDILEHPVYGKLLPTGGARFREELKVSTLIGDGENLTPMVLEGENLYLHKFWSYEQELAEWITRKSKQTHAVSDGLIEALNREFDGGTETETDWQNVAVLISLVKDLVVISGGPGTGKTHTVRKIISMLEQSGIDPANIALAAPTGKAAQRLNDSLGLEGEQGSIRKAKTVHKLLGAKGDSGEFRYHQENKLPEDVIIVDEASMLDISLWVRLIRAIPERAKLILLGDKNQLASVEAGSILGDICRGADNSFSKSIAELIGDGVEISGEVPEINDCIVLLTKSYRFGEHSGIRLLSDAINQGDGQEVLRILKSEDYPGVGMAEPSNQNIERLINDFVIQSYPDLKSSGFSFEVFNRHRILCALRKGPFGAETINELSERRLKQSLGIASNIQWFDGRPVLITKNNSLLKLRNGETGLYNDGSITFESGIGAQITPSRLPDFELSYANTVHKSQGSEYKNVAVLLSNAENHILSKELLYTSVTRGRQSVLIIGYEDIITSTVRKVISRKSGLRIKIWK